MKSCIIIGGGYSIKEGIEKGLWDKIKNKDIWSLNFAYKVIPYNPSRQCWVDINFFSTNIVCLQELNKKKVPLYAKSHPRYSLIKEIIQYYVTQNKNEYYGQKAIEKNKIYIGRMGMVGQFALSLAIAEGYKEIYLLGYDFGNNNNTNKTHFYQDKLMVISSGVGRPHIYRNDDGSVRKEIEDYSVYLKEEDVKIWNVSLVSHIPYFDKISYDQFFEKIK